MGAFDYSSATASRSSRWITNPKHMPLVAVNGTNLLLKTSATTYQNATTAAFYTALALRGAVASISVADTYVTVANLTGSGFLMNLVSPTHTAGFIPTFRLTIDGTVYTIAPSANQAASARMVLGPLVAGYSISATATAAVAGDSVGPNAPADPGFNAAITGGLPVVSIASVPTPEAILSMGWPALRFESSCVIEMKASLLSGTAVDKQCGATYRLDL